MPYYCGSRSRGHTLPSLSCEYRVTSCEMNANRDQLAGLYPSIKGIRVRQSLSFYPGRASMGIAKMWRGIGVIILMGLATTSVQGQDDRGAPERAVRAVLDRQVVDWNKGDLDGFLGGYWNSPKVVFQSGGQRYDGWE